MATSFIGLANDYLLHGVIDPSDEQLTRAATFGIWMQEVYGDVENVVDLSESVQRWQRDGAENWRDEDSPYMINKFAREDRAADRRSGITWQPGARKLVATGGAL